MMLMVWSCRSQKRNLTLRHDAASTLGFDDELTALFELMICIKIYQQDLEIDSFGMDGWICFEVCCIYG